MTMQQGPTNLIGVQNDDVVLKDVRQPRERNRDKTVRLGGGDGPVANAASPPEPPKLVIVGDSQPPADPPTILNAQGEPVSSLTWDEYLEWRKKLCRPYDYTNGPRLATHVPTSSDHQSAVTRINRDRALEEIDQATLELVGEVAELGELLASAGATVFVERPVKLGGGPNRDRSERQRFIDECGDILFCAVWALDAWGLNPLYGADDLELIRVTDEDIVAQMAQVFLTHGISALQSQSFAAALSSAVLTSTISIQSAVGLTANSLKKLRYHRREQNVEQQVARICGAMVRVNGLLVIANSSVEEALKANMKKLNHRYPDGYKPGQAGGNREGAGA